MNAPLGPDALASPAHDGRERGAVFTTSSQAPVSTLTEAVLSGLRVVALTGEPGISRSAIVDALAIGLAAADIGLLRVHNGAPGPFGVSRLVALVVGGSYAGAGRGVEDDLQRVVNVLTSRTYRGKRLVLLIEDAENLDRPALAMLRLLPGLHRPDSPAAQLVLVGRSGLWTLLAGPAQALSGKDATEPASSPGVAAAPGPMEDGVARGWPSLLSSFELGARLRGLQAGLVAGKRPVRWLRLPVLLTAVAVMAVAFLAYHAFYRGLPFRPASLPEQAVEPAPATASLPPQPRPDAQPGRERPGTALEPTDVNPQTSAGEATPRPVGQLQQPSPEKLRADFDAFLLSQGGDMARLSEADRRELFQQYLSRRLAR